MKAALLNWLDGHMREVLRGAAVAFIIKIAGAGIAFAFNVYLARALGAQGAGVYFLALSVITVSSVIAKFGMDNTLLRFVAANASTGDWRAVTELVRKSLMLVSGAALVLTAIIMLLAEWAAAEIFHKPELEIVLRIMALAIYPISLVALFAEMLRALKRVLGSQVLMGLLVPLINLIALYGLVAMWGVLAAPISYVIAATVVSIFGWYMWRKASIRGSGAREDFTWKQLLDSCFPLFSISLINEGFVQGFPYLILGMYSTSAEVGLYGAAVRTSMLVAMVLVVVNFMVAPKMAELYHKKRYEELAQLMRKSTLAMSVLVLPVIIVFAFFPGWFMSLFGEEFKSGAAALFILTIGQAVNVICGPVGYYLIMTGQEKLLRTSVLISAVVLAVAALLLVPEFGAAGAATASAMALIATNAVAAYFVKRKLAELIITL